MGMKTPTQIQEWCNAQWHQNRINRHSNGVSLPALVRLLLNQVRGINRRLSKLEKIRGKSTTRR